MIGDSIDNNIDLSQYLFQLIKSNSDVLQPLAPVTLQINVFRFIGTAAAAAGTVFENHVFDKTNGQNTEQEAMKGDSSLYEDHNKINNKNQCHHQQSLNELNERIIIECQNSGVAVPSSTVIHGNVAIRINITNHRTTKNDLDILIDTIIQLGKKI